MRILQVTAQPQRRGAEIFAGQLNDWLAEKGHSVYTVFLYHHLGKNRLNLPTATASALGDKNSRWERFPGVNPWVVGYLHRAIRLFSPDVVQANGSRSLKYCSFLHRLPGRQTYGLVYRSIGSPGYWARGRLRKFLMKRAARVADAVVAVSDATLSAFGSLPTARRIYRGVDLRRLQDVKPIARGALETSENTKVLIYVGSLTPEKCPVRLVRITADLISRGQNVCTWFLGHGSETSNCAAVAKDLDISDRVRFLGAVDDVGPYIAAADLHLLTSDTEGLPGCIVESSALGRPCVASDVGGVGEILMHGETGFLVQPDDISGFSSAVVKLLDEPDTYERFSARARAQARKFSLDLVGQEYLELYRQVAATEATRR